MEAKPRGAQELGEQAAETAHELSERARAVGSAAWERAKMGYSAVQEKTVAGAQATDKAIRNHPYQTIGIAFGAGLLFGYLLSKKP